MMAMPTPKSGSPLGPTWDGFGGNEEHPTPAPNLEHAIEIFLVFKRSEGLTKRTLEWYATSLGAFCAWLEGRSNRPKSLPAITPLDIAEWLVHQQDRGLSPLTVEGSYRALSAFFNWCEHSPNAGHVPSPIGHGHYKAVKRPKVDDPDMDFVAFEEFVGLTASIDLASWIDYRDWCMISVMFWCGVRSGELLQMEMRDLNLAETHIKIRHSKARRQRNAFLLDDVVAGIWRY